MRRSRDEPKVMVSHYDSGVKVMTDCEDHEEERAEMVEHLRKEIPP
jgi:hypothetical protein